MGSRRERRAARRERRAESPLLSLPFRQLRNPLPPVELLAPEQIEQLHNASMHILENVGLELYDNEALQLWKQGGAKVDIGAHRVWPDRELVLAAVAQAPASFQWLARNPERHLTIGGNAINFAPNAGMAYATNHDEGRHPSTFADLENFLKLAQMCNVLHFAGCEMVAPQDIPPSIRHLRRLSAAYKMTDKVARDVAHGRVITADNLKMARIIFGDPLPDSPVMGGVINVNSPLRYDERMLGGLITYARAGQVNIITPFILAGAMSPITMMSALAQQNAEALMGVALTQLVRPGAPVIYGGFTTNVDMKSGSPAFGTPEGAWAMLIGGQLARYYGLPYRGSGSLNNSKLPDAQAAYETNWTVWPAILAHTNFVHHSVGWLEGGLTASYEKFIIDAEGLAMFFRFCQPLTIHEDNLALEMIAEVGPGGHHFGTPHTQERFASEFYQSFLSDRLNYESWLAEGGLDAVQRANTIWKMLLEHYERPPLDPAVEEELDEFVARRERELEGVNLYD